MKTLVFVYGTLKRGYGNHHILEGAEFIGPTRTDPGFTLYGVSSFPGMVRTDTPSVVRGEVYRVTPDILERLDMLESEGTMYLREPITVWIEDQGGSYLDIVDAYIWNFDVDKKDHIGSQWPAVRQELSAATA